MCPSRFCIKVTNGKSGNDLPSHQKPFILHSVAIGQKFTAAEVAAVESSNESKVF